MSFSQLPDFARELLNSIAFKQGFNNYTLEIKSGSQVGDGFSSELFSITISENNDEKKLDLVCKVAPANKTHRKEFLSNIVFNREASFYDKFMPKFAKFQEEKNVPKSEQFVSFPKCYAALADDETEQFAIILEDLRPSGFKLWNKAKPSPVENLRLAMREIGKFHGLSIAMKDQNPEDFVEFKQMKDFVKTFCQSENMLSFLNTNFDRAIESLKDEKHKNITRHLKNNILFYIDDCLDDEASNRFVVLCHGDFWNDNILYHFNERGAADDVRFLDWQVIRYVSPAIDLLYNIFTSTDKALRDEEYDNLIALYYQSLAKMVKSLGSNPDELFTFQNLKDELTKCGNYALIMAPCLISISVAESSEISNFDEIFDKVGSGEGDFDLITGLSENGQQEFDRRINEVFEDVVRLGYYQKVGQT